jgi:serine/threonine-protein kinase RsbW
MCAEGLITREPVQAETFGRHPREVPAARRFVRTALAGHPAAEDAELLTSELVTNAVARAQGAAEVTVRVVAGGAAVHVEIADNGTTGVPAWREPTAGAESGRGFQLVNEIATRWGFLRDQAWTCC